MKKLSMYPVTEVDELAWPEQVTQLTLWSPAIDFFTDFCLVQPQVIEASVSAEEARKVMLKTHVRLMIVINDANEFVGVLAADDVTERKIVQQVAQGYKRSDVSVTDLMTPRRDLLALSIDDIEKSSISTVIESLKDNHQQHCLVIDLSGHKVRGIFSASDISRKLKLSIDVQHKSDFYRVFSAIA